MNSALLSFNEEIESVAVALAGPRSWGSGGRGLLVDSLLSDQGALSAVERFAQFHENAAEPLQGRYYRALLPASPPGPGEQLAFDVDLDRCSGCKACVAACHALNGLDDGEAWREVGLLIGGTASLPVLQHVTSACHHCLDPACLDACPVDAFEKDPVTGIVKHLDDQCFGCRYCTLACPYDVPKFHAEKGIVRKCDMCSDRLSGEAPACVQACPHEAIRITVIDIATVRARASAGEFLPAAFEPSYTAPTTIFRSLPGADLRAADENQSKPEHAHLPLVVMLVLTQLAVGGFLVELAARLLGFGAGAFSPWLAGFSLAMGYAGLAASLLHLGRPIFAYRAILGWRHSWLSREVIAFGVFAMLATAVVSGEALAPGWMMSHSSFQSASLATVVFAGLCGVGSSVMVYHVVRRPFWRASVSGVKFAGSTAILGLAAALASLGVPTMAEPGGTANSTSMIATLVAAALIAVTTAKLWFEERDRRERGGAGFESESLRLTARLLRGQLTRTAELRRILGLVGGVVLPVAAVMGVVSGSSAVVATTAIFALGASIGGELLERTLFFRAVRRPKMPGGLPS